MKKQKGRQTINNKTENLCQEHDMDDLELAKKPTPVEKLTRFPK